MSGREFMRYTGINWIRSIKQAWRRVRLTDWRDSVGRSIENKTWSGAGLAKWIGIAIGILGMCDLYGLWTWAIGLDVDYDWQRCRSIADSRTGRYLQFTVLWEAGLGIAIGTGTKGGVVDRLDIIFVHGLHDYRSVDIIFVHELHEYRSAQECWYWKVRSSIGQYYWNDVAFVTEADCQT